MKTMKDFLKTYVFMVVLIASAAAFATVIEGYNSTGKKKAFDYPFQLAGYNPSTNSTRVDIANPLSEMYVPLSVANETNKANGTYYYYIPMNESRELGCSLEITGTVTVTVEATNEPDCAPASCGNYPDVSNAIYGAANWTADAGLVDTGRVAGQFKYVRFKVVTAGGGTDDYELYCKRLF